MSAPVFLCPAVAAARVGGTVTLDGPEGHHAVEVQRLGVGERIDLVDGQGTRARSCVMAVSAGRLEAKVEAVSRDADRPLVLVQALAKHKRDEAAIEAATELGVTRVVPWQASRSIVRWEGRKAEAGRARWASVVAQAAKVARRALVPEVSDPVSSPELVALVSEAASRGAIVLLLHEDAGVGIAERVERLGEQTEAWIVVGPEGSIADDEAADLTRAGALATRLGPYILRSGSAGPAALAALKALTGDWTPPTEGERALG
ncbi:MAG: 16S rRNA (uracil(1498)-N(3))-methyltransferase [Demequinaceae bacterium]|nr:16S rRNA (uracil(1498)-N(3))-methyltransferase [Demequinaceae bacterium]